jgi:hypothetical protein
MSHIEADLILYNFKHSLPTEGSAGDNNDFPASPCVSVSGCPGAVVRLARSLLSRIVFGNGLLNVKRSAV